MDVNKLSESIFTQFIEKRKVIAKNKKALQTTYIPDELPHRKEQIDTIASIISAALRGDKPSNIMVYGKTGTGKTAVLNYIGKELKKADENGEKCQFIYINCEIVDTPYSVLYSIGNQIIIEDYKRIPFTGWSFEKVYREIVNYISPMNKVFVVVLDEINKLIDRKGDDVVYYLAKINENLEHSKVSLIGVSNNMNLMDLLEPKSKSRFGGESILFPPYGVSELEDILRKRVEEAFDEDVIDDDVIRYCAQIGAKTDGDARISIDLLKTSADVAERMGDKKVEMAHVKSAQISMDFDVMSEAIKMLPPQSKLVMISIIRISESGSRTMSTGDVYRVYKSLSSDLGTTELTQRRVIDLIGELDSFGLINASVRSFGRQGRTTVIELSIGKDVIDNFKKDSTYQYLESISHPKQTHLC